MAVVQSIFFQPQRGYRKYEDSQGYNASTGRAAGSKVGSTLYQLDGVISEQHESTATVTKHPVEYGVSIADHVIKQPTKIIVNGIVTNSPFLKQTLNRLPGDSEFGILAKAGEIFKGERARNAYAGLIELQNERKPVSLQTGLLTYENMVLTGVSAPNDVQGNLRVRLTFEEVFIADGTNTGAVQAVTSTPIEADFIASIEFMSSAVLSQIFTV